MKRDTKKGEDALMLLVVRNGAKSAKDISNKLYEESEGSISLYEASTKGKLQRLIGFGYLRRDVIGAYRGRPRYGYSLTREGEERLEGVLDIVRREGRVARLGAPRKGVVKALMKSLGK